MGDASASASSSKGSFTLPTPPFITSIPGLANLRDVGGYPISIPSSPSSRKSVVKRGILYRAAEPSSVDDAGAAILVDSLGIKHVYDLRSAVELAKRPETAWDAGGRARRVFVPVFLDKDYSPEAIALRFKSYSEGPEGFVMVYSAILESAAHPAHEYAPFRTIIEHLAGGPEDGEPEPLLVHCTAGKDRMFFLSFSLQPPH